MAKVKEHSVIFNKGLNTSLSSVGYDLHPVKMDNCWLSRDDRGGAVEQMPGYSLFHTFADDDVAIQSIGSAGIKKYSFTLYGLGSTKFYRHFRKYPPLGSETTANVAIKTGLTDGNMGTILFYGDVDGKTNAWVFNGADSPLLVPDQYDTIVPGTPYGVSDIGVARPYVVDYAIGSATDRIYIVAGDADSGPEVQYYMTADEGNYTNDTTDANDEDSADVALGPATWSASSSSVDGFYVASDVPFGGIGLQGFAKWGGSSTAKFTYRYWNGSGWQSVRSISDETEDSSGYGFMHATVTEPEITWTIPSNWAKKKITTSAGSTPASTDLGPYYWIWCAKKAGVTAGTAPTCNRVFLLDQTFGEDEAEGVVQYRISKLDGTSESALSGQLKQADGTEGIDAGTGGTVKIVIDKSATGEVGSDPNAADYYDGATFKVYRTYEDGAQPYDTGLRIETGATAAADEGAGEVEDNIADNELGNLPYLHGDVPPSACLPALAHFNRIFAADPSTSRVYWSDLANPESFWTDDNGSYAEIFPGDGDEITALARDREGILVFKHNHLYKLAGRTPDQFYVQEITLADMHAGTVGAPSIRCVTYTPSGIVFYYNKAVYLYNGSYPVKISGAIDEDLRAIDSKDEEAHTCIGYYAHRNQIYVSVSLAGTAPDATYIFDMDVGQWSGKLLAGFRQFLSVKIDADTDVTEFASETGEFFLGVDPAATGKVFQLDNTSAYESAAIESGMQLSPFFGSSINKLKTFMYVDVLFEPVANGEVGIEWWINGESGDSTSVTVEMDKTGYGIHRRRVNIGYKGRDLTLKLKNTAGYTGGWKVYGFVIGYIEHESFSL